MLSKNFDIELKLGKSGPVITWSIVMVLVSFRNGGALEFERKS